MTTRLQVAKLCLGAAVLKYKQHRTMPTTGDARALLAELGVNGAERVAKSQQRWIETEDELRACAHGTVLRDAEARVIEQMTHGWWITGEPSPYEGDIDLPARVLYTPEDET